MNSTKRQRPNAGGSFNYGPKKRRLGSSALGTFRKSRDESDDVPEERETRDFPPARRKAEREREKGLHLGPNVEPTVDGSSDGQSSDDDNQDEPSDLPLEVLERLRRDGVGPSGRSALKAAREAALQQYKRHSRHMPAEESAKRPVPRFREVIQVAKSNHRDPRFEPSSGMYDKDRFMQQYSFLYKDVLPAEREHLKAEIKRAKSEEEASALKVDLGRIQNKLIEHSTLQQQKHIVKEVKSQEKEAVAGGKTRFFVKKSDLKKKLLIEKYKALEKSGKLEKFMEKRRKKNAAKDHRKIPRERMSGQPE